MANLIEPILRTRFSDMTAPLFTHQKNEECRDFELKYVYCMEAHGKPYGDAKCKDFKDDLNECVFKFKQIARTYAMKAERDRQYKAGERKKEEYFGPVPPADSY